MVGESCIIFLTHQRSVREYLSFFCVNFALRKVTVSKLNSIFDRPMCPACKHRLRLARISPGKRGFEERTFECSTCHRVDKISLPVDPLKTDAVGWLAGELKPPQQ